MTRSTGRYLVAPLLLVVFLVSSCSSVSGVFESGIGKSLGFTTGEWRGSPLAITDEEITALAKEVDEPESEKLREPSAELAIQIRGIDPATAFGYTFSYDACTQEDPRLLKRGSGLVVSYDNTGQECFAPEPVTTTFAVQWANVPTDFYLGRDAADPTRVRVVDREIVSPPTWSPKFVTRTEQPNSPSISFTVAQTEAEYKRALKAPDLKSKSKVKYRKYQFLVVVRAHSCRKAGNLVLLEDRYGFFTRPAPDSKAKCGTNTVESSVFIINKEDVPKKFTLGVDESPHPDDVKVKIKK